MAQPYVGQIIMFGGNFAPAGWMTCSGQLLPISEYDTLFNLIGTTYGGDGQSTFGLPDLQGRVPIHQGQGSGLSPYIVGQNGGVEGVTLTTQTIAAHNHLAATTAKAGTTNVPGTTTLLADEGPAGITAVFTYGPYDSANQTTLLPATVGITGGNQPHENRQPVLAVTFCISLFGVYPSQN
jgi:microcystin-dependent protein